MTTRERSWGESSNSRNVYSHTGRLAQSLPRPNRYAFIPPEGRTGTREKFGATAHRTQKLHVSSEINPLNPCSGKNLPIFWHSYLGFMWPSSRIIMHRKACLRGSSVEQHPSTTSCRSPLQVRTVIREECKR